MYTLYNTTSASKPNAAIGHMPKNNGIGYLLKLFSQWTLYLHFD